MPQSKHANRVKLSKYFQNVLFISVLIELCKTIAIDGQEIKISTRMKKFHFWVKYAVLSKTKINFWKILIFVCIVL